MATELGPNKLSSRAKVSVKLVDANDNRPTFEREKYTVKVHENVEPGTVILKV